MKAHPQRRSTRLPDYDYSQPGAYYVTVCTHLRDCLFGDVHNETMIVNEYGQTVQNMWQRLPDHYPHVRLDHYVVMPNHFHGIILLVNTPLSSPSFKRYSLPEIVRAFKTYSARQINRQRRTKGIPVWQRSFYEHIVRNDNELNRIRQYIINNPVKWALDQDNPAIFRPRPL